MINLLLLSSSRAGSSGYLEHAGNLIKDHLADHIDTVLFIPFAGVTIGFEQYEHMAAQAFAQFGFKLVSIHQFSDPQKAINDAQAIAVGGGNTFCLLNTLYEKNLLDPIRERVQAGIPYIGWSAGSNICGPTIRTTNDMPIIEPRAFTALQLLPVQINPHYIEGNPPGHNGETREQRINEFLAVNPNDKVIALPEGTALKRKGNSLKYLGELSGFLFSKKNGKQTIAPGTDLSELL